MFLFKNNNNNNTFAKASLPTSAWDNVWAFCNTSPLAAIIRLLKAVKRSLVSTSSNLDTCSSGLLWELVTVMVSSSSVVNVTFP